MSAGNSSFVYRVVLPVVAAVGITVATVGAFAYWSTAKSDDRALQRETHLVGQVISQQVEALAGQQDYYSNWDEAVTALKDGDIDWVDENLAADLYSHDQFDRIYVLDPKGAPLYAMYAGGKTSAEHYKADQSVVEPMLAELKKIDAAGALAAYDAGNSSKVPYVADIAEIDGRPAYVGVSAVMSESGDEEVEVTPGSENFLICVRFLDGALAGDLANRYFIDGPAFSKVAAEGTALASYPLKNKAGATVGWFTWKPDRPGALILKETLPALLGALAIAGVVLVLLLRSLRRTTAALEAGRADAEFRANHDVLTGLANRAFFNKRLEEALNSRDGSSIALLALDLDRFKQVNDTLGHEAGDQLLREVGARLTPLVGERDTVARLGGDEFAVIQRGVTKPDDVGGLSNKIITALGVPFVVAGRVANIGVSIGVVITPGSQAPKDIASKADIALYEAKAAGRNTFRIFDDAMQPAASFRDKVGEELQAAKLPVPRVA